MIKIKGAKEHNLKNIDISLPEKGFIVITGPSGSGKSTLVKDILYREALRRFVELISHQKEFRLPVLPAPAVDSIDGLLPAILFPQQLNAPHSSSTVGTITKLYEILRIIYSKIAIPNCPKCGKIVKKHSISEIIADIENMKESSHIWIVSPVGFYNTDELNKSLIKYQKSGYTRVLVNNIPYELSDINLNKTNKLVSLDIVIDRLIIKNLETKLLRIQDSLHNSIKLNDKVIKLVNFSDSENKTDSIIHSYSLEFSCPFCGYNLIPPAPELFSYINSSAVCKKCHGSGQDNGNICYECSGKRLSRDALCYKINGLDIGEASLMQLNMLYAFINNISTKDTIQNSIINVLKPRIESKLQLLINTGLNYLSLFRTVNSLSLGEWNRVRLASIMNANLDGMIYIFDEPTAGLSTEEVKNQINIFKKLSNNNCVIVVEHDIDIIKQADFIVELGIGGGKNGGKIIFTGKPEELLKDENSPTGKFFLQLSNTNKKKLKKQTNFSSWLVLTGVNKNNLKNIDIKIPFHALVGVKGKSGTGKTTLISFVLYQAVKDYINNKNKFNKNSSTTTYKKIESDEYIDNIELVDQNPLSRSSHSNVATYLGFFNQIRNLFSSLPEAKKRGFTKDYFSFNNKIGVCSFCKGEGEIEVEIELMPDLHIKCPECSGKRFRRDVLEVKFKGHSIADILDLTIDEAAQLFNNISSIAFSLNILQQLGLGYLVSGQPSYSLSGGEAQRLKLASVLIKKQKGHTIFIIDEPTQGLHIKEISNLIEIMHKLKKQGHTIIIIEHNTLLLDEMDYSIELS